MENKTFKGNYFKWLATELKRVTPATMAMLFFGIGFQLAIFIDKPINMFSIITLLATIIGLACTTYMARGASINGLLGLVSAIGFIVVNIQAKHYASILDQLFFIALIDIPIMVNYKTWGQNFKQKVRKLSGKNIIKIIPAMIVLWVVLFYVDTRLGSNSPIFDALSLTIGATASVLCFLHYTNTYDLWLLSDLVNIGLWISALSQGYSQASLPMLVTMILYTVTSIYGRFFSDWSGK